MAGDRIVDIWKEPDHLLFTVKSAFTKVEEVVQDRFDARITIGEDAKFITKVILKKEKFGVMKSAQYNFRSRYANTSLTQTPKIGKYTLTMELYYKHILDYSVEKYGRIIPYVQHLVVNGLKYRVLEAPKEFMTDKQREEYVFCITEMLKRIDDEVMGTTLNVGIATKLYLYKLKYGCDIEDALHIDEGKVFYQDVMISKLSKNILKIDKQENVEGKLIVSGRVIFPITKDIKLFIKTNDEINEIKTFHDGSLDRVVFTGKTISRGSMFNVSIKATDENVNWKIVLGYSGIYYDLTKEHILLKPNETISKNKKTSVKKRIKKWLRKIKKN